MMIKFTIRTWVAKKSLENCFWLHDENTEAYINCLEASCQKRGRKKNALSVLRITGVVYVQGTSDTDKTLDNVN